MPVLNIKRLVVTDTRKSATPSGFYASAIPSIDASFRIFVEFCRAQNFPIDALDKPHITLMYSKELPIYPKPVYLATDDAKIIGFEYWLGHDEAGYLVAKLNCKSLNNIHQLLKSVGCVHSFEEFSPHITLCNHVGVASDGLLLAIDEANKKLVDNNENLYLNLASIEYDDLND